MREQPDRGALDWPGALPPRPLDGVAAALLADGDRRRRWERSRAQFADAGMSDFVFGTRHEACRVDDVFRHLRWGGQFVFTSLDRREARSLCEAYGECPEFAVERSVFRSKVRRVGLPFGLRPRHAWSFVARKVLIDRPTDPTERYSYEVRLVPWQDASATPDGYAVLKQVPPPEMVERRLRARRPEASDSEIRQAIRKLVTKVFPTFLTREAAFLMVLNQYAPAGYRDRFPRILDLQRDERGFVRRLVLNWLRMGGPTLSQLEFARQCAELLQVLHDEARIIHLDLRLDNIVVTERGVGFVDFGSAARVGEEIRQNALLNTLFTEMLSASQVQRDLRRMVDQGRVTSRLFTNSAHRIDRAADLFYLILQVNRPHLNPDLRGLVDYDPHSVAARRLSNLTRRVLRPDEPDRPEVRNVAELCDAIGHL